MSAMRKHGLLTRLIRRFQRWRTTRSFMRIELGGGCDYDSCVTATRWLIDYQVSVNDGQDSVIVLVDPEGIEARELLDEHDLDSALPPKRISWTDIESIYVY
jgi:hypothetical protein